MPKINTSQTDWVRIQLNEKRNGYFVDVGAYEGIHASNTCLFERNYNWKGICIEANPRGNIFEYLLKNRTCICENVAIFSSNTEVKFMARGRRADCSGIFDPSFHGQGIETRAGKHPLITIQTVTLEHILDKHKAPKIIDYLSIDTEGAEYEIIRVFPFNKYQFRAITIEHNAFTGRDIDIKKQANIRKLLTANGYKLFPDNNFQAEDWFTMPSLL
tara:strand:+ start:1882 stop:2529 length:648 start_codon:yes stop_codon:yes gene_type:complete